MVKESLANLPAPQMLEEVCVCVKCVWGVGGWGVGVQLLPACWAASALGTAVHPLRGLLWAMQQQEHASL